VNWTLVCYLAMIIGFAAIIGGLIGIATLPDCSGFTQLELEESQACSDQRLSAERFYDMVRNIGFAAGILGAFGLLGRFTGVLRRGAEQS
jgi:hypothetical protein